MTVRFPEQALDATGTDIEPPLKELQQGLGILPDDKDMAKSGAAATFTGPPDSVAIIEAGATALSKWWSVVIAALGGTAVITAAATKFWSGQAPEVRVGLIGGMAGLLIAALIAISVIVSSDVKARGQGTVAMYTARATIAAQFLQESLYASRRAPAVPLGGSDGVNAPGDKSDGTNAPAVAPGHGPNGAHVLAATQGAPLNGALASDSLNQLLGKGVPIFLAASSAPALVLHKPSNQTGHLAGVRQLSDRTTELLFVRQSDQQTSWCMVDDLAVTEFTYSLEAV